MPTSHATQLEDIIRLIFNEQPYSILDIGCGRGKYGLLAREYLEEWGDGGTRKIDAVEVFPDYITELQRQIYDEVHIGNALDLDLPPYDLYLLVDVIEHFTKEDGHKLLDMCRGNILISTPHVITDQEDVHGNEYERHLSHWTVADFKQHGAVRSVPNERSLICLIKKGG